MSLKITFLGAAGEVTGSCFLLETASEKILVDMGMFQGEGADEKNHDELLFDPKDINGVVLTHAHLDHCGRLPILAQKGFKGDIWATKPTIDLASLVLFDSAHIADENLKRSGEFPLYMDSDVSQTIAQCKPLEYDQWQNIGKDFKFRLLDAGHILGSASVEVKADGKSLVFSGDLGNDPSPLVKSTEVPQSADVVMVESTYGDRIHPPRGEEVTKLSAACKEVESTGGTLLLPAFSLERTQELLHLFDHLKKTGQVSNELVIYLDSPMGLKATAVFERYPSFLNSHLQEHQRGDDPFDFPGLTLIQHSNQSKRIWKAVGAKVIIAGSGMMSGGRMVMHAKHYLPRKNTIVLFTGYQASGTLGRRVFEGSKQVLIDDELVDVNAKVEEIQTMSGHADQKQILDWLRQIKGIKQIVLIHGENDARQTLRELVAREFTVPVDLPLKTGYSISL